jgi:predicted O-methyltransferase YrrM
MITSLKIENYISTHLTKEDDLLKELDRVTNLKTLAPRMLSGHVQGNFLSIISSIIQPKRILEIGTFTGYSALSLASGLVADGLLYTIDRDEETGLIAQSFFKRSNHCSKIKYLIGDAKLIIPTLKEQWDIVFIDADKEAYPLYYHLVIDNLRSGGIILADNILWSGKITEEPMDKKTRILHEFNMMVSNDDRVKNVILPLRDGVNVIMKK